MTEKGKPTEYSGDSNHRNLSKREFARKLYKLKNEHGLNQSEVGRRSGISRDMISRYIQGNAMPGPENLAALAKVFDMEPSDLLPNSLDLELERDDSFVMRVSDANPSVCWFQLNRKLPTTVAAQIITLITEADEKVSQDC